jgi:hypothetical protein
VRPLACVGVGGVEVGEVAHGRRRDGVERALDHLGDARERQLAGEERVDGDLVRRVQDARRGAAGARGLARQAQARERVLVGALERQLAELGEVERTGTSILSGWWSA